MKSVMTKTGAMFVASFILCIVDQAQKTSAAFDENVDLSNYKTPLRSIKGARAILTSTL